MFSACALNAPESFSFALESGKQAKVIASYCNVYTDADFSSEKITVLIGEEEKPLTLKHNEIVDLLELENDFAKIKTENEIEGYVYKYYLTQNTSQVVYPVFNASIRNNTQILDMDLQPVQEVEKGTRVLIYKGYSEKEGYTAVQVVLGDQSIYNGYVLTKDVNPDGISGLLITGISIIIAAVTVILAVVFIKKKKKK